MSTFNDFDPDANANGDFNLLFKSIDCAAVINGQCQTGSTFASTSTSGPYEEVSQKSSSVPDEGSITSVTTLDNPSTPIPSATTGSPATSADPPTSFSSAIPSLPPSTSSGASLDSPGEPSASKFEPTSASSITAPSDSPAQTESVIQTSPNATVTGSHSSSTNASQKRSQTLSPSPEISTTGSVVTQDGPASTSPASGAVPSSNKHSNHTGAIVGGVIGGLVFLLLATAAAIFLYRRMRARRTAPSAEFMDIMRGTTPGLVPASGAMRAEGTTTPSGDRLLGLQDGEEERPPAFMPSAYGDPVLEKVQAAAAMREQYQRRDSFAAAQADYKEELGDSEVGHEDESTEVGTEEDYGDEKAGYTWAM